MNLNVHHSFSHLHCILYPIFAFLVLPGDECWEALEPGQWNVSINSKSIMLWRTSSFDATMHCARSRKIFSIPHYMWSVTHSCSNPLEQPCSDICNSRILYITGHTMIPLLVFPVWQFLGRWIITTACSWRLKYSRNLIEINWWSWNSRNSVTSEEWGHKDVNFIMNFSEYTVSSDALLWYRLTLDGLDKIILSMHEQAKTFLRNLCCRNIALLIMHR